MFRLLKKKSFELVQNKKKWQQYSKDNCTEIQTPGIYEIPYSCRNSYIGKTDREIEVRIKEYKQDVVHNRIDKLTAAEH